MCKWNHVRFLYDTVGKVWRVARGRRWSVCLQGEKYPHGYCFLHVHRSEWPRSMNVISTTPPHPAPCTLWSYVSSSLSCSGLARYQHHPTPPFGLMYPQVCLAPDLHVISTTPPHPAPPFGLMYPQVCLAADLYVISTTPPHPAPPFGLMYPQVCLAADLCVISTTPPHPTLWSYVSSSLSCCWPVISTSPPHPCRYKWDKNL